MTERELLLAAATTAWRPRTAGGGVRAHPAWSDLDAADRLLVYDTTVQLRPLEAALDANGLSTTARAVLARLPGGFPRQPPP